MALLERCGSLGHLLQLPGPVLVVHILSGAIQRGRLAPLVLRVLCRQFNVAVAHVLPVGRLLLGIWSCLCAAPRHALSADVIDLLRMLLQLAALLSVHAALGHLPATQAAPEAFRSRILAIFSLANMGGMPLGGLILGSLSVVIGGEISLWVVSISMFVILALFRWRQAAS